MLVNAINQANTELGDIIKRLSDGKYMFGTRHIIAKIINNGLLIRVGGGYMTVDEFIDQYGKIELMKMRKLQLPQENNKTTKSARNSQAELGEFKTLMRKSINMQFGQGLAEHKRSLSAHRDSFSPKEVPFTHETGNYFVANKPVTMLERVSQGVIESYSGLGSPVKNIVITKSPTRN